MWWIILIIVWAAALASQWKHIASLAKLYFRVITHHETAGEKAMMLLDIVPMCLLFIAFYIIIWPIPAAVIALFKKLSGRSS
jgi:hypothetical protein